MLASGNLSYPRSRVPSFRFGQRAATLNRGRRSSSMSGTHTRPLRNFGLISSSHLRNFRAKSSAAKSRRFLPARLTPADLPNLSTISGGKLAGAFAVGLAAEPPGELSDELPAEPLARWRDVPAGTSTDAFTDGSMRDGSGGCVEPLADDFRGVSTDGSGCNRWGEDAEPFSDVFSVSPTGQPQRCTRRRVHRSISRLLPLLSKISWEWRVTASARWFGLFGHATQRHGTVGFR